VSARHRDFPLFDSLRAIAFTCVLVTHAAIFAGLETSATRLGPFYARLDLGVDIFFVISAFLLYRPFALAHIQSEPPPRVRAFAWRRVLRIVPPYWLMLTVVGLWIGAPTVFQAAHIPFFYGFAQIYNVHTLTLQGLPQAWSLCVEASFYVFLPLYALLIRRLPSRTREQRIRMQLLGAGTLIVLGIAYNAVIGPPGAPAQMPYHFALPAFVDYFALGIALATLSVAQEGGSRLPAPLRAVERRPALAWLLALVAFIAVSKWVGLGTFGTPYSYSANLWRHVLYGVVALGMVLPAVFGDPRRGVVRRILANRFLRYVGTVSYAAYLLEFAVLIQLQRWHFATFARDTTPYAWFVVAFLFTIALASISWFLYERPILRLKGLVSATPPRPREDAALEPPAAPEPAAAPAGAP
jgi:peptidoglycan/LPS O-acetylase OafA/YrhL